MTNCSLQSHRHKACAQSGCGLHPCSPHSPSRPTRATQSYSRKRLNDSENGNSIYQNGSWFSLSCVFKNILVFENSLRYCHYGRRPGSRRANNCALCHLKWMPVIRAPESIYKYQSQTCHKLAAFGTLGIEQDCSFTLIFQKLNLDLQLSHFWQSTTASLISQTPQRKQTKVLQLLRNRLDLTCILCSVMNTVADSETAWFWQCFA